jgi:uncharacterized protein YndB with AHSA1/START domain
MNAVLEPQTREIVVEEFFPHAPELIWRTLTTGELIARWLPMPSSGFAPVVGTRFTYQTTSAGPWDGTIHCQVLEVKPQERFAYSWKGGHESNNGGYGSDLDTVVTWTLTRIDGGTRLRMVHSGFVMPRNETAYQNMGGGWSKLLARIGAIAGELAQ